MFSFAAACSKPSESRSTTTCSKSFECSPFAAPASTSSSLRVTTHCLPLAQNLPSIILPLPPSPPSSLQVSIPTLQQRPSSYPCSQPRCLCLHHHFPCQRRSHHSRHCHLCHCHHHRPIATLVNAVTIIAVLTCASPAVKQLTY